MAMGADNEGQNAQVTMLQLSKDPFAALAVYERAPNGTARIAATHNYSGDEDALVKIITDHVNQLWTPHERRAMGETQTALFRHARAAAQRIEDKIYLTLSYPDDFSKRSDNAYPDKRVGITAYSVHFPAEEKPTEENTRVKAFKDNIRILFQLYNLSRPRLFPGKEEGQITNDPDKVLTASKGYEKLIILEDVISAVAANIPEEDEQFQLLDEAVTSKISFPESNPKSARHKRNWDAPSGERPALPAPLYVQTGPVDLSSLVPLDIPPVLEEKNPVFDALFLHIATLVDEMKTGEVDTYKGLRNTVRTLNELCYNTTTGKDGNLCYIITPKALDALRIASIEWAHIPHLATAYGRINMRAQNLWKLAENARAIIAQRDALAKEVRTLRKTETDTLFSDDASAVTEAAHADSSDKKEVDEFATHLGQLLAYASRKAPKPKEIDDRFKPVYDAFDATVKQLVSDATTKANKGIDQKIEAARKEERTAAETRRSNALADVKSSLKAEFEQETASIKARAERTEKEVQELRKKADKARVAEKQKEEAESKNETLINEKAEVERQLAKLRGDYKTVVTLFTDLETEVRETLEGEL